MTITSRHILQAADLDVPHRCRLLPFCSAVPDGLVACSDLRSCCPLGALQLPDRAATLHDNSLRTLASKNI